MNSSRRDLIEEIYNSGYKNVIEFRIIDSETLLEVGNIDNQCELILSKTLDISSNRLFMHMCPHDEKLNPGYSFAGIYNSYKPLNCKAKAENIYSGLKKMSKNKVSQYADYYYGRNHLKRTEKVDLLISSEIENACGSGTVYVSDDFYVGQYYLSPRSYYKRESIKFSSISVNSSMEMRICKMARDLYKIVGVPLDVEFVITLYGKIYVSEVRQISYSHLRHWGTFLRTTRECVNVPSCIVNSVGSIEGKVVCVDRGLKWQRYLEDTLDVIFVVNYKDDVLRLFLHEMWKKSVRNIKLIINYNDYIIDNHEQYMCYEDSGISFITKTIDEKFADGNKIRVTSDGWTNLVVRE